MSSRYRVLTGYANFGAGKTTGNHTKIELFLSKIKSHLKQVTAQYGLECIQKGFAVFVVMVGFFILCVCVCFCVCVCVLLWFFFFFFFFFWGGGGGGCFCFGRWG